ncbi:hypothetical protein [Dyella sp.]|uniref:hypothetical protein n=1 Tax=Dyella sp. TaxID=1869338 RepID=UPI002ED69787
MDKSWQRALIAAYRPVQLRGMLVEGQHARPQPSEQTQPPTRQRALLLALLAGWFRHSKEK